MFPESSAASNGIVDVVIRIKHIALHVMKLVPKLPCPPCHPYGLEIIMIGIKN